ncbi:MAG: hypothetical protein PHF86_06970 [Candidatus Nanoarchaeia archaeon]|nr:hypothetical protein [Candidatus Nanoarchaeia archaeon]
MSTKQQVEELIESWNRYCWSLATNFSDPSIAYFCEGKEIKPVQKLINLGCNILPYLKESILDEDLAIPLLAWPYVIEETTGKKCIIPNEIEPDLIRDCLLKSLDDCLPIQ